MSDFNYSDQIISKNQSTAQMISNYFSNHTTVTKNSATSGFSGMVNNLSDYSLIRKGTYSKLMKAYYGNLEQAKEDDTEQDSVQSFMTTKQDAKDLKIAADAWNQPDLYKKVTKTVKDEKTGEEKMSTDYDWDTLYKNAGNFVKAYNAMMDSAADMNSTALLKQAVGMTNITSSSSLLLEDIGISVDKDNKLSIDETKFKNADMNKIKIAFSGQNSYANKIAAKASSLYYLSSNAAMTKTNGGSRFYTSAGDYTDLNSSSLYNDWL